MKVFVAPALLAATLLAFGGCVSEPNPASTHSTPLEAAGMWVPGVEFSRVSREATATGGIVMDVADDRVGAIEIGDCQQFTIHWPPEAQLFSVLYVNSKGLAYPVTSVLTDNPILQLAALLQSAEDGTPDGLAEHCGVPETYLRLASTRAGFDLFEAYEAQEDSLAAERANRARAERDRRDSMQAVRLAEIARAQRRAQAVRDSIANSIPGSRGFERLRTIPLFVIDSPGEATPCGPSPGSGGRTIQGRYTSDGNLRMLGVVWRDDGPDVDAHLPGFAMYRDCVVRRWLTWQPRIVFMDGFGDTLGTLLPDEEEGARDK
ncbi:hypothetical protein [Candidatus Palauibacter sp.]|uniref:hypothetical protein n=1 Tax=Candidatus Palauibacter sp. TaxID=3101350 RepID=UPI003B01370B